tara:strand:- start:441 stop:584 length:144 start_codon:yes stop_codon:yes gene_type:complete
MAGFVEVSASTNRVPVNHLKKSHPKRELRMKHRIRGLGKNTVLHLRN